MFDIYIYVYIYTFPPNPIFQSERGAGFKTPLSFHSVGWLRSGFPIHGWWSIWNIFHNSQYWTMGWVACIVESVNINHHDLLTSVDIIVSHFYHCIPKYPKDIMIWYPHGWFTSATLQPPVLWSPCWHPPGLHIRQCLQGTLQTIEIHRGNAIASKFKTVKCGEHRWESS